MKIVLMNIKVKDNSQILLRLPGIFGSLIHPYHLNHANNSKYYVILIPLNRPTFAFTLKLKIMKKLISIAFAAFIVLMSSQVYGQQGKTEKTDKTDKSVVVKSDKTDNDDKMIIVKDKDRDALRDSLDKKDHSVKIDANKNDKKSVTKKTEVKDKGDKKVKKTTKTVKDNK